MHCFPQSEIFTIGFQEISTRKVAITCPRNDSPFTIYPLSKNCCHQARCEKQAEKKTGFKQDPKVQLALQLILQRKHTKKGTLVYCFNMNLPTGKYRGPGLKLIAEQVKLSFCCFVAKFASHSMSKLPSDGRLLPHPPELLLSKQSGFIWLGQQRDGHNELHSASKTEVIGKLDWNIFTVWLNGLLFL